MITTPTPSVLREHLHAALDAEREHDRGGNQRRGLDRPVHVVRAALMERTTILHLDRDVHLGAGGGVLVTGAAGARMSTVRIAEGRTLEVDGRHPDVEQISGQPLHLSERLQRALEAALRRPGAVLRAAAGWDGAQLGRAAAPNGALLHGLETDQVDALERSLGSNLLLVLGPPGTGKTFTLARTVAALISRGERVLLLAPTHAAVDTALARIRDAVREAGTPETALLRQGRHGALWQGPSLEGSHRSRTESALADLEVRAARLGPSTSNWVQVLADAIGCGGTEDATGRIERVRARANRVLREDGDRLDARALLRDVESLHRSERTAALPPRLVAATLAEALVRTPAGPWDTVIIDEGAMANVPYSLWAASLAGRRLLVWGDPHQLGPVCAVDDAGAHRYLGRSLFHHLGCDRAGTPDPRRPVLKVQHRMAPEIRRLVAGAFYDDLLADGAAVRGLQGSVEVMDSGGLARAQIRGGSRINEVHARMAAARVARLWASGTRSLAVLTPYRAQVDVLRAAIRARVPEFEKEGGLIGTAHSAQGSEFDAVVVDLVATRDSPGRWLDERSNPGAAALLCVAMSRARLSLTVISDRVALPAGGAAQRAVAAAAAPRAA